MLANTYYEECIPMKSLIKAMDNLPLLIKLILCIPAVAIVWMIYRLCRSLDKNNLVGVVLAIVLIFVGIPFMWLVDLLCILMKGNVWWID
jgi:hypothetical protein